VGGWQTVSLGVLMFSLVLGLCFWDGARWAAFVQSLHIAPAVETPVSKGTVLIVAAQPKDRSTAALTVAPRGYRAVLADTVTEAMVHLAQDDGSIRIAVIDGALPGSDGIVRLLSRSLAAAHIIVLHRDRSPVTLPELLLNVL
jgi:hypothetical protein